MSKRSSVPKDILALGGIKKLLFGRRLIPGQKLIYRDLEEALGMSKTPIKNALVRLEQEGVVVSQKNRGYFVKELSEMEIRQMYELRENLEEIAIDYAINNHEKKDLLVWKKCLDRYNAYQTRTYDSVKFQLDIDLHTQIARMGKNFFLVNILSQFYLSSWAVLQTGFFTTLIPQFKKDHDLLFQAITSRNRSMAKKIIRRHFRAALKMALQAARRG